MGSQTTGLLIDDVLCRCRVRVVNCYDRVIWQARHE